MGYWTLLVFYDSTGRLRIGWRLLIFYALVVVCLIALALIVIQVVPRGQAKLTGGPILAAGCVFATWFCLRRLEGQPLSAAGIGLDRPWLRHLGIGFAAGGAAIVICWVVYRAAGWATVTRPTYDLLFVGEVAACVMVMAGAAVYEELAMRGYPFQALARWNLPVAFLLLGAVFAVGHGFSPGAVQLMPMINLFLAHMIFALAYLRTRSLWLPIGLHLGWNITQGNLLGMSVSGNPQQTSFLQTELQQNFWTGGAFGPEGGLVVTLLALVVLVCMWLWMPQRSPTPDLLSVEQAPSPAVEDAAESPAE